MTGISGSMRKYRKSKRLTQEQVANLIGIRRSTYSRYEEGTNRPSWKVLMLLADLYGITMDELVGREMRSSQGEDMVGKLTEETAIRRQQEDEEIQRMLRLYLNAHPYAKETALLILEKGQGEMSPGKEFKDTRKG